MIVVGIGMLMLSSAVLFQNCSPTKLESDAEKMYSDSTTGGDSSFRLPAGFNETLNTGVTCSVAANATTVAVGGTLTFTVTPTGNVAPGYRVYAYGTKNGIPDANEVAPDFATTLIQTFTIPSYIGGNYTRYFQMRDSAGRVLCQTNTVAVTLAGTQCTLSTPTLTTKQGFNLILNTAYAAGTTAPTAAAQLRFDGFTNGVPISVPYDSLNFTSYIRLMTAGDAGNEYVRRVVMLNADGSIYCQTNNVRITVLR